MTSRLASSQLSDGSLTGEDVGTSYVTSIALIILGLPYQNVPIFQR